MALEGLSRGIFRSIGLLKNKRKLDDEELREMTRSLRGAFKRQISTYGKQKRSSSEWNRVLRRRTYVLASHADPCNEHPLHRTCPLLRSGHEFQPHGATLLLVGLYGQGKTTTTAKLQNGTRKKHGLRVGVIEADVHRPGAYAQLTQLLEDTNVQVYGEPETKDAPTIVRNGLKAIEHACRSRDS